ncbi:hypothetical protein EOM57_01415 [Candidatus Saccharibacteria bacterium]|nr:hypothetical protein [Candidatus Saccharibacteria bacterium]NCU38952.1 hypothetical protein [Candidatus Saccharibacteria bacterium]
MKSKLQTIKYKISMAAQGIAGVMRQPRYAVTAAGLASLFATLIYFFIEIGFYGPLLSSGLPIADKLAVVASMVGEMLAELTTTIGGALLAVVALLQGVAFATMTYNIRRNKKFDTRTVGSGGAAMLATALGLGCVPCGTSLVMPIVTLFFSSSAYAAANTASTVVLVVAFVLSVYSLYTLGGVAYAHVMIEQESEDDSGKSKE